MQSITGKEIAEQIWIIDPIRSIFEKISKVFERVEAIFFGGFNDAKHDRAGFGTSGCISKQEVFAANHKRLDAALGELLNH